MIAIKHRFSGATLCEFNVSTLKEAAVMGKNNLQGADLQGANLQGANLQGANLRGANLDGEKLKNNPLFIYGMKYFCIITEGYMRLGCQRHT